MSAVGPGVALVEAYIDACCRNPSKEKLRELLAEDVVLEHVSNFSPANKTHGREKVYAIYVKDFFNVTHNIVVKQENVSEVEHDEVYMNLIVEEDKTVPGKEGRYRIQDRSTFAFKLENEVLKICRIKARVDVEALTTT